MAKIKLLLGKKVQKCIRKSTYVLENGEKIEGYTAKIIHPDNRNKINANFLELKDARRFVKGMNC